MVDGEIVWKFDEPSVVSDIHRIPDPGKLTGGELCRRALNPHGGVTWKSGPDTAAYVRELEKRGFSATKCAVLRSNDTFYCTLPNGQLRWMNRKKCFELGGWDTS